MKKIGETSLTSEAGEGDRIRATVLDPSYIKKHSIVVAKHATSLTLENAFWNAIKAIAVHHHKTLSQLITEIDQHRTGNLSSAVRVFVLENSHTITEETKSLVTDDNKSQTFRMDAPL